MGLWLPFPELEFLDFYLPLYMSLNLSLGDLYLTIILRAQMGSESIAHEAEGLMGY